jgi:hypothetical protein
MHGHHAEGLGVESDNQKACHFDKSVGYETPTFLHGVSQGTDQVIRPQQGKMTGTACHQLDNRRSYNDLTPAKRIMTESIIR